MFSLSFDVLAWSAWAPGLETEDQWRTWFETSQRMDEKDASPDVHFIPAMQRRRLSRLSKMTLKTLYQCIEKQGLENNQHGYRTVFASPHGEIHRTVELLQELANKEPVSPMGFSLSVHNTAAGIYSILSGNKAPSTSVASGRDTLEQAVIEAVTQSYQTGEPVALSYADEPLPAIYSTDFPAPFPFSLSLLVNASQQGKWSLQSVAAQSQALLTKSLFPGIAPLSLLLNEKLLNEQQGIWAEGERHHWHWIRHQQ